MTSRSASAPPFTLERLDHIVLRARDVANLVRFYTTTLGCSVERVVDGLTQLRAGQALIDVVPRAGDIRDGGNVEHFCLTITPFEPERLARWLADAGARQSPVARRYGAQGYGPSLYLTDPEGNRIELKAAA